VGGGGGEEGRAGVGDGRAGNGVRGERKRKKVQGRGVWERVGNGGGEWRRERREE